MNHKARTRAQFGTFELNVKSGELHHEDKAVLLQQQSFRLLLALLEQAGEVVTREELQKQLWPNDTMVEFDLGINAAVRRLRRVLGDSPGDPHYIETVGRQGYRLMVPVHWATSTDNGESEAAQGSEGLYVLPGGLVGQEVSHYRILEVLGSGGMGVIYRAEDLRLGRLAALKFLPEEFSSDARALAALEREACLASSLNHPNICSVYELGTHKGQPFIAMELLTGETLRDCYGLEAPKTRANAQRVPVQQLLDIAMQVCEGLKAAHDKGIIHRDIKPANIFLTSNGMVKILDFGLAKLVQNDPSDGQSFQPDKVQTAGTAALAMPKPSRGGIAIGTAAYMSPEHIRGQRLDARTDLFSLGVVVYQMATAAAPFQGEAPAFLFDAILHKDPVSPSVLNPHLPSELEQVINRALQKDRNLRYQSAAEMEAELRQVASRTTSPAHSGAQVETTQTDVQKSSHTPSRSTVAAPVFWLRRAWWVVVLLVAVLIGGLYWHWRVHRPPKLTDRDTIVLADFDNKTGDPVFDDTLKQALAIQLEQSPFLDLLSQGKVSHTLMLMGRQPSDALTPDVAREVCQRTGSKAVLSGSIAALGSVYVIGLKAVNCETGDVLAETQEQASGKEAVLKALDAAAVNMRSKLGESLSSVQKYAAPLAEATTSSLEALRTYSLGYKIRNAKGEAASLPFFEQAVELDPNFAMGHAMLAVLYANLNELGRAGEQARKAYALRGKVSERERLVIESYYYTFATGELEKAAQVYELWRQTYPKDSVMASGNLALIYAIVGNLDKASKEQREVVLSEPKDELSYRTLGVYYVGLNRLDEAAALYKQAEERKPDSDFLIVDRYQLAFLKGDSAQMAKLASAAKGKPSVEDLMLAVQADTEAWYGRLRSAREFTRQAMELAQHNDAKETAAMYQAAAALREVAMGNRQQARDDAEMALKLAPNRDVQSMAALALAQAGDTAHAEKLAAELDRTFPLDTLVQNYWLPTIRAAVALERNDPNRAVELLKAASTIELGQAPMDVALCPAYLRGEAYFMLHDGKAAAAEFQKFVDHYGFVGNFSWGALARLGVARAYALEAQTDPATREKARTAYQNFLTLWKDADPDIPIYQQAKAEYAKLQ